MRLHTYTLGLVGGLLALALGLAVPVVNGAPAQAPQLQPSPRPTLVPTATPTAVPTARPTSIPHDDKPTVVAYGRLTGTVIDARTGAPASGISVMAGDASIQTDVSGNYDHWLPVGEYTVSIQLSESQGWPVQGSARVAIGANGTTVQHFSFESPAPVVPTEAPVAPAEAAPVMAEPTVEPAPVAEAPAQPASNPERSSATAPRNLPETGVEDTPFLLWLLACVVLAVGESLSMRSVRLRLLPLVAGRNPRTDNQTLLAALIIASPRRRLLSSQQRDKALLDELLNEHNNE